MNQAVNWISVCGVDDIIPDMGVCVQINQEQIAIFKEALANQLYAISNYDPNSKANVLSRGLVGSIGDRLVVASPIYKQHFCLATGECLESGEFVKTYPVQVVNGEVQVAVA